MKFPLLSLLLTLTVFAGKSQESTFEQEMKFVQHLEQYEQENDALFVLEKLHALNLSEQERGTVHYKQGYLHYRLRNFDRAAQFFNQVNLESPELAAAAFFASISHCYDGQYRAASTALLNRKTVLVPKHKGLLTFQLAGHALLRHDLVAFDSLETQFSANHFAYLEQQEELRVLRDRLSKTKRRSPFVAGLLSTAVPGLGKIYAGKTGQGLTNFFVSGILGLSAYEQYRKVGLESPQFYIFASLFTAFYIGNIYGSVYSVNVQYNEQIEDLHNAIVFQLHIPVRTIFN